MHIHTHTHTPTGDGAFDHIEIGYSFAQAANGCSVLKAPNTLFPDFIPVCNTHDKCYYVYRTHGLDGFTAWEQSAWPSCNEAFKRDIHLTCGSTYLRSIVESVTVDSLDPRKLVKKLVNVIKIGPNTVNCIISAAAISEAVDKAAVITNPETGHLDGVYVAAQKKQLRFQQWIEEMTRKPHCTITGTVADDLTLTIDDWQQEAGRYDQPYFSIKDVDVSQLYSTSFPHPGHDKWKFGVSRVGNFQSTVKNEFTDDKSQCGVVVTELGPDQLPLGFTDIVVDKDQCRPGYTPLTGNLNSGLFNLEKNCDFPIQPGTIALCLDQVLTPAPNSYLCGLKGQYARLIDDIAFATQTTNWQCPSAEYIKDSIDLHVGSGSLPIYLCKRYISLTDLNQRFIHDITSYTSDSSTNKCPQGYEQVPTNLNDGTGGNHVYLCKQQ